MMKNIIYIIAIVISANAASAQNIDDAVRVILSNNKLLKAKIEYVNTINLEYKTNNLPPNPSISYTYLMNSADTDLNRTELIIGQKFDFPSTYFIKGDIARKREAVGKFEIESYRQEIALKAKNTLLEYIFLLNRHEQLQERFLTAQIMVEIANKRYEAGDIGITDYNKSRTEMLKLKNSLSMSESNISYLQNSITELNGGQAMELTKLSLEEVSIPATFNDLYQRIYQKSIGLKSLQTENDLSESKLKLANHQWLPGFEIGYRQDNEQGTRFSGLHFGLSIPLFENMHKVSKAESEMQLVNLKINSYQNELKLHKQRLFDKLISTQKAITEYKEILGTSNNALLLRKSLEAGNISISEYYLELGYYYEIQDILIELQKTLEKTASELTIELFEF